MGSIYPWSTELLWGPFIHDPHNWAKEEMVFFFLKQTSCGPQHIWPLDVRCLGHDYPKTQDPINTKQQKSSSSGWHWDAGPLMSYLLQNGTSTSGGKVWSSIVSVGGMCLLSWAQAQPHHLWCHYGCLLFRYSSHWYCQNLLGTWNMKIVVLVAKTWAVQLWGLLVQTFDEYGPFYPLIRMRFLALLLILL